ncbi:hypothetical protein AUEXF2481DRAFT_163556 [Aureobasidium subglaciale EXF-2481]|uniref:Uncharacterized protein n=1 Tax=Aureobasidium subglaciale (strain EXF-2481) TaxID=1043005 RepID=A0A074ZRE6_AURSE|nr:uncharacterized protein AUEXF2481DRAFT_163556 [Aureobasidium subglaciale EXF-2481]KER00857.1 hypothetical protein AUEXF2481DRAFT_163556 [Aureobasidium subglaciale EXF-2481]
MSESLSLLHTVRGHSGLLSAGLGFIIAVVDLGIALLVFGFESDEAFFLSKSNERFSLSDWVIDNGLIESPHDIIAFVLVFVVSDDGDHIVVKIVDLLGCKLGNVSGLELALMTSLEESISFDDSQSHGIKLVEFVDGSAALVAVFHGLIEVSECWCLVQVTREVHEAFEAVYALRKIGRCRRVIEVADEFCGGRARLGHRAAYDWGRRRWRHRDSAC